MCAALAKRPFDFEADTICNSKLRTDLGTVYASDIDEALEIVLSLRQKLSVGKLSRVRVEPRDWEDGEPAEKVAYPTYGESAPTSALPRLPPPSACPSPISGGALVTETQPSETAQSATSTASPGSTREETKADLWGVKGLCYHTQSWMKVPRPLAGLYVQGERKLKVKEVKK